MNDRSAKWLLHYLGFVGKVGLKFPRKEAAMLIVWEILLEAKVTEAALGTAVRQ